MKKNLYLLGLLGIVLTLTACQPKTQTTPEQSGTKETETTVTTTESTMDGVWKTADDAKQTFSLSIDGTTLAYQGKNESGRATYDPLKIKKETSTSKDKEVWQFIDNQTEVNVTEKYREADAIFIDSDQEIKESVIANTAAIPDTIRINRAKNTISYTLANDNEDVKNLVKGATLTFNAKSNTLVYTSPYGDTFNLERAE